MDIRANLSIIPAPRIERGKKHLLVDILLLCIIAMVCGVESVEDITFFGITHLSWLKQYLLLPNGILRVLARIDHTKARGMSFEVDQRLFPGTPYSGFSRRHRRQTVRGSAEGEKKGIHLVSAWADKLGIVLGQVKTGEKSNEITAIPELLSALELSGCVVTTQRTKVRGLSETDSA